MAARKKTPEEEALDNLAPRPEIIPSPTPPTKPSTPPEKQQSVISPTSQNYTPSTKTPTVGPKVEQDTGIARSFTYPDGRTIVGLSSKEVDFLTKKYGGFTPQTPAVEPQAPMPQVNPEVSAQDIAKVGLMTSQINPQTILNTDEGVRKLYNDVLNNAFARQGNKAVGVTDTLYDVVPGGKYKKALMENIVINPDRRRYLSGYSNENNLGAIKRNLDLVDIDIENAKTLAAIPGFSKQAIDTYQSAQAKKRLYYTQLKILSSADQRAYVSDAKDKMAEIEQYWASGKTVDDLDMQNKLTRVNGVQNG